MLIQKCVTKLQKLLDEKVAEIKAIIERRNELNEKIKSLKANALEKLAEIKKHMPADKMTPEQETIFNVLASMNQEQILKNIHNIEAKLTLHEENPAAIAEYNERKEEVKVIETQIEEHKKKLNHLQRKINEKKKECLPKLKTLIQNINSRFSYYYHQIDCAGEISLDDCDESDDFFNYGLQITLKYRDDEPFEELSNAHHSGGECSVAAILFILSLQELIDVPFRCIDEINQGMDSQNERNIYNLIADSNKSGFSSQYFLLTPKLLMDLELIEDNDVTVHIIFNSLFLETKLDVQRHIDLEFDKRI